MELQTILNALTDPENQPHQFVNRTDWLKKEILEALDVTDLKNDSEYAEEVTDLVVKFKNDFDKLRE